MKRILAFLLLACLLAGCAAPKQDTTPTQVTSTEETSKSTIPTVSTKPSEPQQPTVAPTQQSTTGATSAPTQAPSAPATQSAPTVAPTQPTQITTAPTKPDPNWVTESGKTYYLNPDGSRHTGWLKLNGQEYYFQSDGSMATGKLAIDGLTYYFGPNGARVILVNPWHFVPYGYTPNLVNIEGYIVDSSCRNALQQMLNDCRKAGYDARITSAYRTQATQIELYNKKVNYFLDLGYEPAAAREEAAKIIAIPGTSEHQLGLAVDLVDSSYWVLDEAQEKTPAQKWLMKHCWEYGFILRYPNGKTDKTGIIYEPWHYRYVGKELAMELKGTGLCLEEYFDSLQ